MVCEYRVDSAAGINKQPPLGDHRAIQLQEDARLRCRLLHPNAHLVVVVDDEALTNHLLTFNGS